MKSIIAFSDSHNVPLPTRFLEITKENDFILFAGDGLPGISDFFMQENFFAVSGNCDAKFKDEEILKIENTKVLLTHGHKYSVKNNMLSLLLRAKEIGAKLVVFGHTHTPFVETIDGVTFVNGGSMSTNRFGKRSYAYISIQNNKILTKVVEI